MQPNKAIVFLPGWSFLSQVFEPFVRYLELSSFYSCLFVELPSLKTPDLEVAVNLVAPRIPNQSLIIAWSLGGLLAWRLCERFPDKCERLILLNSTPRFFQGTTWGGVEALTVQQWTTQLIQQPQVLLKRFHRLVNYPNHKKAIKTHIATHQMTRYHQSLLHYLNILFKTDLRDTYSNIKVPMLHLLGEHDAIVSTKSTQLQALNTQADIKIIKNAGHSLFLTHPIVTASYINQIL